MGSIRTWSLAAVAGVLIVVVAHQRSNADAGTVPDDNRAAPALAAAPATMPAPVPVPASSQVHVGGLPDFSDQRRGKAATRR